MKKLYFVLLCLFLSSCARGIVPIPETFMPERYSGIVSENEYGKYPENYQKILKDYLINNLLNQSDAKIEFVNQPSRLSIEQMGDVYHGYRVCLSINSRNNKNIYTGYKTHLFIIKNDNVLLHLFDSGLLKIPFELCVDRDESKTFYLDDIPDNGQEITIDNMDKIEVEKRSTISEEQTTYILCKFQEKNRTFLFNESQDIFSESVGIEEIMLENIKYSSTHIFGELENEEILINRVSGEITSSIGNNRPQLGMCELLDSRKF